MFSPIEYDLNREHLNDIAREAEKRHASRRLLDALRRERKNRR